MKKKTNIVKVIKKTTAVTMAATTAVGTVGILPQAISHADEEKKYIIEDNQYMTRLRENNNSKLEFELSFAEYNKSDEKIFDKSMAVKFIEEGKIQINDGKVWSVKDAGFALSNDRTESSFVSTNKEFIKDFYKSDKIKVKIITPDGREIIANNIKNALDADAKERYAKEFGDSTNSEETSTTSTVNSNESNSSTNVTGPVETTPTEAGGSSATSEENVAPNTDDGRTNSNIYDKNKFSVEINGGYGIPRIDIEYDGIGNHKTAVLKNEEEFVNTTEIKLNDKSYGKMSEVGFRGKGWQGTNTFRLEDFSKIKDVLSKDTIKITLITKEGEKIELTASNSLTAEERKSIIGETPVETSSETPVETSGEAVSETPNDSDLKDGVYKADISIIKETEDGDSMANSLFAKYADINIEGDEAEVKIYVVYPIPNFADQGQDGTVKDFYLEYNGKKYEGSSDITSKPKKPAKSTIKMFGLTEGQEVSTQVITIRLPKEALKQNIINAGTHVNVVMNSDVKMRIRKNSLEKVISVDETKNVAKNELANTITLAESKDKTRYTDETVAVLVEKLNTAKAVNTNEASDIDAIKNANTALLNAISGLVEKPIVNDNISTDKFHTATVHLMHSSNGAQDYPYTQESMAGPVLVNDAEIIETASGKKLIMHFRVTEIMGARSYATGLKLTTEKFANLPKDDNGNITTEFKLFGDNSGICIVDLPSTFTNDTVYEGHIYSNIMDNTVAIKVSNVANGPSMQDKLNELIRDIEAKTNGKNYYDKGKIPFDKALQAAKQGENYGENYINLLKASADLREKLENPFVDGDLFFIPVENTSTFASPTSGDRLLKPIARVTKVDGKTRLELDYTTYTDFSGMNALGGIKILDKEGHPISGVEIHKNPDHSAKVVFDMPFFPDGGVFKTILIDLNKREYNADLILDYSGIEKGMNPKLLENAIHDVDYYQKNWIGEYNGRISRDRAEFYTEKSFKNYVDTIKKCEEDLKPENRANLTQEIIDKDIKLLKEAKNNLVYKAMAGRGSDADLGVSGLSNPGNVYMDENEQILPAPWSGSKIRFGNRLYKVLNTGLRYNSERQKVETGNLFIMADDYTVTKPWSNTEPTKYTTDLITRWDGSEIRKYLNGEFLDRFDDLEKSAIKEVEVDTKDGVPGILNNSIDMQSNSIKTRDKVYLLSIDEVKSPEFGFANVGTRKNGKYTALRNISKESFYSDEYKITGVKPKGNIENLNQRFTKPTEVYPVMNLDKSKIAFTIQSGYEIGDGLKAVKETEKNIWDIILKNDNLDLNVSNIAAKGNKIRFDYTSTNSLGKDMVAVLVEGDLATGKLKSIGKIGKIDESGRVEFNVTGYDASKDKLYIMPMDMNSTTMSAGEFKLVDTNELKTDKTELFNAIREGKRYNLDSYKQNSTTKLSTAISNAESVYSDDNATTETIDSAISKIQDGITALVVKEKSTEVKGTVPVKMMKSGTNEKSMANGAIDPQARFVESNGKNKIILTFKPMKFLGLEGHLLDMQVGGRSAKVEERYSDGHIKDVSFEVDGRPNSVPVKVEVDAMNELAGERSYQDVDISLDWNNMKSESNVGEEKKAIDGDIVSAVYKEEKFEIAVKENTIDKIVLQIPKKLPKRSARSLVPSSIKNSKMENITFIKKDNNWVVSEEDKDKIKDFKIASKDNGKLEIHFKLNEAFASRVETKDAGKMKVSTFDSNENTLHSVELKANKDSETKVVISNPTTGNTGSNGTIGTTNSTTETNSAAESKIELLGELAKDNNAKYLTYNVEVTMMKVGTNEESMSKNSVDKIASVVEKDGMSEVTMTFKPMKFMGLEGHLLKMTIGGKEVKVVEKDDKGRPTKVSFVVKGHPKRITAEVEVDAMNELNGGKSAPQKVDIVLSWDKKTNVKEGTLGEETSSNKTRLAGANRIETSIAISKKYFNKADNVVLVSATNLADALISSPYAKMKNAPTLLTDKEGLSESLVSEIKRLGVKNITIIGGVNSVSDKVVEELKALGINVERIAGENRYETSEKVANEVIKNTKSKKIAVVNGEKNADALSVSSLATKEDMPIVMVRNNVQDKSLAQKITGWNIFEVVAVGGENSISKSTLSSIFSKEATRIAGANRYETAVEVAKKSYPQPESVFVTNGETMVDALSAGAVTYKEKAPIVLVEKDSMSSLAKEFTKTAKNIIIVGGANSVSDNLN